MKNTKAMNVGLVLEKFSASLKGREKKGNEYMTLKQAWKKRLQLFARGAKLQVKGDDVLDATPEMYPCTLRARDAVCFSNAALRWLVGEELFTEGALLWAKTVLALKGNILIEWKNWNEKYYSFECWLETGEVFGFPKRKKRKETRI